MLMVPLRRTGSPFALTRYEMVPSPWPGCPERISIHVADDVADQLHSRATDTFTSPVPPAELKLGTVLVTDAWQRVAVGPVTVVTALLPQEAASAQETDKSRARTRTFTAEANTRLAPSAGTRN